MLALPLLRGWQGMAAARRLRRASAACSGWWTIRSHSLALQSLELQQCASLVLSTPTPRAGVLLASAVAAVATAAVAGAPTGTLCGSLGDAIWRRLKVLTLDEEQWRTSTGPGPGLLAATSLNTGDCSEMLYGACSPAGLPANLHYI